MKNSKFKTKKRRSIEIIKQPETFGSNEMQALKGGVSAVMIDGCTCNGGGSYCGQHCGCNIFIIKPML